ncbi:hypothetical protein RRG08_025944 [Elysia crispata]|uniref:Uncharacterized protein n=1 Tax=Elysia crispata TaxID=231223 RepID=A0AAE0ZGD7_9GAST|nr:hypothetical protein RRG08_025944 [Elysia crispata]
MLTSRFPELRISQGKTVRPVRLSPDYAIKMAPCYANNNTRDEHRHSSHNLFKYFHAFRDNVAQLFPLNQARQLFFPHSRLSRAVIQQPRVSSVPWHCRIAPVGSKGDKHITSVNPRLDNWVTIQWYVLSRQCHINFRFGSSMTGQDIKPLGRIRRLPAVEFKLGTSGWEDLRASYAALLLNTTGQNRFCSPQRKAFRVRPHQVLSHPSHSVSRSP